MGLAGAYTFVKTLVESEHVGSVGLFFSAYAAAAIVLRIGFGWVPERIGPKRALMPALGAVGVSLGLLAVARDEVGMAAAGVFAGLGHGYAFPILSALVVHRADPADRGSAVALFTAIFDAGILVGSPLLGVVARTADLRTMFAAAAALPILGASVFAVWDRGHAVTAPASVGASVGEQ